MAKIVFEKEVVVKPVVQKYELDLSLDDLEILAMALGNCSGFGHHNTYNKVTNFLQNFGINFNAGGSTHYNIDSVYPTLNKKK